MNRSGILPVSCAEHIIVFAESRTSRSERRLLKQKQNKEPRVVSERGSRTKKERRDTATFDTIMKVDLSRHLFYAQMSDYALYVQPKALNTENASAYLHTANARGWSKVVMVGTHRRIVGRGKQR